MAENTLTDADKRIIDQARNLAKLRGAEAIRKYTGCDSTGIADTTIAYVDAFGEAQWLLGELTALAERLNHDGKDDGGDLDDPEPYCATCGTPIGIFQGQGEDWHHYRGQGTTDNPVVLDGADHETVVAWRKPGGQP